MINIVKAYLLQNKSVSIPGLGTIYVERLPAQSDFVNRQLLPPSYHFRFDKYFDTPGKDFFAFLSSRKNIHDFEAIKEYNEWALRLRNDISGAENPVPLNGIGTLQRAGSGEIVFEPSVKPQTYSTPVAAERIIRTNAKHSMIVGDRELTNVEMNDYLQEVHKERTAWWIYALIIAAIALVAIFFSYYRNGGNPFGNQQKIESK